MDEILKIFQNPPWWVLIILAWIFGSLMEKANRGLARSWVWYRQRRGTSLAQTEQKLELLVAEPHLLTLHTIHSVIFFLHFIAISLMFMLLPIWTDAIYSSPELATDFLGQRSIDRNTWMPVLKILMPLTGITASVAGFLAGAHSSFSVRAYTRLYKRKKAEFERNTAPTQGKPTDADVAEFL